MRRIVIKVCGASANDKTNLVELVQSGLHKLGIDRTKVIYNVLSNEDAELEIPVTKAVLEILKKHGTTTLIPTSKPTDTAKT